MVNARRDFFARCAVLLLAAAVLTATAWNRGAEYDEQYTLFVTSGTPRPIWPTTPLRADAVTQMQAEHADVATVARDLRRTDVHPPLYFWAVVGWRAIAGDGLFAIRMLSVACALAALTAVGAIARRCAIPPALAMLLTLGCYGFAYTGGIARGFALAQMLTLAGIVGVLARHWTGAGLLLGCAVLTNYLAVFVAATVLLLTVCAGRRLQAEAPHRRAPGRIGIALQLAGGFVPPVLLAGWFFMAQRDSRPGQFPPFEWLPALLRIARYAAANLTGGLPLYAPEPARIWVAAILASGLVLPVGAAIVRRRCGPFPLVICALAPALGLLALGFAFDNTPIELRYLAFGTPFAALLVARARPRRWVLGILFAVQTASIAGLIVRPETMQPARSSARAAAALAQDGAVAIPRGNDGIGIVGAFAMEAPPSLPLLIVGPEDSPAAIRQHLSGFRRAVLVLLPQDGAAQAAIPAMRAALADPGWREIAKASNIVGAEVVAFERTDRPE